MYVKYVEAKLALGLTKVTIKTTHRATTQHGFEAQKIRNFHLNHTKCKVIIAVIEFCSINGVNQTQELY